MHVNYQECPRGQMNQGTRDKSWSMKMFVLEIQLKLEEKKKKPQENLCACMFLLFTFRVSSINCVPEGLIPKVLLILYNSEKLKHWTSGTSSFSADLSPQEIARVKICSSGFVQFALRQIKYLDSCLSPEGWRHVVIQYCSWLDLLCDW